MKNKTFTISLYSIIIAAVVFFLGYLLGRGFADTVEVEKEVVKWKTEYLPAVHDTIYSPEPYLVINTDTVEKIINHEISVDTLAIIADYFKQRQYALDFSTDSTGTFKVNINVSKNALANAVSEVRPIIRTKEIERTISKVKTLQFYGLMGTSLNLKTNKMQVGIDLRQKYLLGVGAIRMDDRYGYTIDLGVKF